MTGGRVILNDLRESLRDFAKAQRSKGGKVCKLALGRRGGTKNAEGESVYSRLGMEGKKWRGESGEASLLGCGGEKTKRKTLWTGTQKGTY